MSNTWSLRGELVLSCSCDVFCPCTLSLGNAPPTEGHCQTWAGIRIDEGHFDKIDLSGINVGLMMDLPGIMARGNWTAALFVDDKAPIQAVKGLTRIFTGRVGGTTHLLSILVGQFLGVHQVPISYETEGETRRIRIEKYVDGAISPVRGKENGQNIEKTAGDAANVIGTAAAPAIAPRTLPRRWQMIGQGTFSAGGTAFAPHRLATPQVRDAKTAAALRS